MSKTTNKFAPEVRERAVRMVLDGAGWPAIELSSSRDRGDAQPWPALPQRGRAAYCVRIPCR
jgi:hypothetical protein